MRLALLKRFETTLLKSKSHADLSLVAIPFGQVDFFNQGATVTQDVTLPGGGAKTVVRAYELGDLKVGDIVQAGPSGPLFTVDSLTPTVSPPQTRLQNNGSTATIAAGTRLIITARRPTVFLDPLGDVPAAGTDHLTTDEFGRASCYVGLRRFDQVIPPTFPRFDTITSMTQPGGSTLSWNHTCANNPNRYAVVLVSFASTLGDNIDSVTIGGQPMNLIAQANFVAVYGLANPPTGTVLIVVTFSGSQVRAVGGAVTASGINPVTPFATAAASGNSANPSVNLTGTDSSSMLICCLGAGLLTSATNATPGAGLIQRWNALTGATSSTLGAGATADGTGSSATMNWTLNTSRAWGLVAVELRPISRVAIDAEGSYVANAPYAINALDYPSLQAAVDDIPSGGGTVLIPAGAYSPTSKPAFATTLVLPSRPCRLLGAGQGQSILLGAAFAIDPVTKVQADLIKVTSDYQTIEGLSLFGSASTESSQRGVVLEPIAALALRLSIKDCTIANMPRWGIYWKGSSDHYSVLTILDGVSIIDNSNNSVQPDSGLLFAGLAQTHGLYAIRCRFANFYNHGILLQELTGASFIDCIFDTSRDELRPYVMTCSPTRMQSQSASRRLVECEAPFR